jgi:hypothetical protein
MQTARPKSVPVGRPMGTHETTASAASPTLLALQTWAPACCSDAHQTHHHKQGDCVADSGLHSHHDGKLPPSEYTNHHQEPTLQLHTHCQAEAASNHLNVKANRPEVFLVHVHPRVCRQANGYTESPSRWRCCYCEIPPPQKPHLLLIQGPPWQDPKH